jgi:antitoxin VapB
MRSVVADRTAKLFVNGGSQAVRLPAEFRFEGVKEVYIRRNSVTGEVILAPKPGGDSWADFFALRDQAGVPPDFMTERRSVNDPLQGDTWPEER